MEYTVKPAPKILGGNRIIGSTRIEKKTNGVRYALDVIEEDAEER